MMHRMVVKKKLLITFSVLTLIGLFQFLGLHLHLMEKDFSEFEYPMYGDIYPYVMQLRNNDKPSVEPINGYHYKFTSALEDKCKSEYDLRLILIVKSAMSNFENRNAIRNSWGFERRFSDVSMRTVFLLGVSKEPNESLQKKIDEENKTYKDIVQANFHDVYYNNTIKTMMGLKWAITHCKNARYYYFVDDDMYVSIKNLLRFIRNPSHYPEYVGKYLQQHAKAQSDERNARVKLRNIQMDMDYELPDDAILYAGYVLYNTPPLRLYSSKWYLDLKEYPYDVWPPYIPAGSYVLSKEALQLFYYSSFYVQHFRFDDIYLSIVAKKIGIQPFHNKYFHIHRPDNFTYTISYHDDSTTLQDKLAIWSQQKAAGNA